MAISIAGRRATAAMTGTVALELDLVQYEDHDGWRRRDVRATRTPGGEDADGPVGAAGERSRAGIGPHAVG
jgi:hypothetical protein